MNFWLILTCQLWFCSFSSAYVYKEKHYEKYENEDLSVQNQKRIERYSSSSSSVRKHNPESQRSQIKKDSYVKTSWSSYSNPKPKVLDHQSVYRSSGESYGHHYQESYQRKSGYYNDLPHFRTIFENSQSGANFPGIGFLDTGIYNKGPYLNQKYSSRFQPQLDTVQRGRHLLELNDKGYDAESRQKTSYQVNRKQWTPYQLKKNDRFLGPTRIRYPFKHNLAFSNKKNYYGRPLSRSAEDDKTNHNDDTYHSNFKDGAQRNGISSRSSSRDQDNRKSFARQTRSYGRNEILNEENFYGHVEESSYSKPFGTGYGYRDIVDKIKRTVSDLLNGL